MLSDKATKILADHIASEVIETLSMSDAFVEFLHEQIPTLVGEKLGEMDDELHFDLCMLVMDKVRLVSV